MSCDTWIVLNPCLFIVSWRDGGALGRDSGSELGGGGVRFMPAAGRRRRMPELPRGNSCVGRSTPGAEQAPGEQLDRQVCSEGPLRDGECEGNLISFNIYATDL